MAQFPSLDLLTEVEELAMCVDGKGVENNFSFLFDEDLNFFVDQSDSLSPEMLLDDDSMLAVDSSSNVLLGDPVFNIPVLNEMSSSQPPHPNNNPETLIPVSLPADSTTTASPPEQDGERSTSSLTCAEESTGRSDTEESISEDLQQEKEAVDITLDSGKIQPEVQHNVDVSPPLRIIVNTQPKSSRSPHSSHEMVAPAILPEPSYNLVKIPKNSPPVGKSSEHFKVKHVPVSDENVSEVEKLPQTRLLASAPNRQQKIRARPSTRYSSESKSKSAEPAESPGETTESLPFWSLRTRHTSTSSVSSQVSGTKRKAYELDPLNDPRMERCRKNAINAKKNREMKKAHVTELERKVLNVSRERDHLAGENESLREANVKLEEQVKHLRNLLENQSPLAALIGKLSPASVVVGEAPTGKDDDKVISSASGRQP